MSKIIVLIGIPCSGKTTFAKEWVNAKQGRIRVNNDDLRSIYGIRFGESHGFIHYMCQDTIRWAIHFGYDVVVDNTNLVLGDLSEIKTAIPSCEGHELEVKIFDTPVDVCIERNRNRKNPIPESAIHQASEIFQSNKDYYKDFMLKEKTDFDLSNSKLKRVW